MGEMHNEPVLPGQPSGYEPDFQKSSSDCCEEISLKLKFL